MQEVSQRRIASRRAFAAHHATLRCARRSHWKSSRATCSVFLNRFALPSLSPQLRGGSEDLAWALPALRAKGYAILQLQEELPALGQLYQQAREFFQRPSKYKETFKCYPLLGGYLTPYPGTYEVFELRRGLGKCPEELRQAMNAFARLEQIAVRACKEIGRDLGMDLAQMPSDVSSAMRCIHYDRPYESRGAGDMKKVPMQAPAPGTQVRLVGLQGQSSALNGLKGCVASADPLVVSLAGAPEAVLLARGSRSVAVDKANLRLLWPEAPGMYPSHTDSSLVTVSPRSSAPGLEVKDLQTGEWFNVEEALAPNECLLFAGDPLDYASSHRYPALMHRPAVCSSSTPPEHRISTPFFLYPRPEAALEPADLPKLVFDDLNGNINRCRDRFPWKKHTCYYSDLVYSKEQNES